MTRDPWGYVLTGSGGTGDDAARGWPLVRRALPYETSVPGVFAVGDVRSRSAKRVASAVGEGSVVIGQVHECLRAQEARALTAA